MSCPISNYLRITSSKDTFETIVNLLVDEVREETTYSKFWPAPEGLNEKEDYEWCMENYQCTKGICATVDRAKQTIYFETNFDPATLIVERHAKLFPDTGIEYSYDMYDNNTHEITDTYENGTLVDHQDVVFEEDEEYDD